MDSAVLARAVGCKAPRLVSFGLGSCVNGNLSSCVIYITNGELGFTAIGMACHTESSGLKEDDQ